MSHIDRLRKLKVGGSLKLDGASYNHKNMLYKTAYRAGIKIMIKSTPDGTKLWRTA